MIVPIIAESFIDPILNLIFIDVNLDDRFT
jgi:hypothetical protein